MGYYLRAYNSLNHTLPYSPYEAFSSNSNSYYFFGKSATDFIYKTMRYPTSIMMGTFFYYVFGDFYIVYLLGFVAVFLLGAELSSNKFGGVLAVMLYAISPENLLHYTKGASNSGVCYVLIFFAIFFLVKYVNSKNYLYLFLFIPFSLLALTSYHTGATALIMLILGFSVSLWYSRKIDYKLIASFSFLVLFHLSWLLLFDIFQIISIKNALFTYKLFFALVLLAIFVFLIPYFKKLFSLKFFESEYLPLIALFLGGFLIFLRFGVFDFLLRLGIDNYYISAVTMNNYFGQAVLTHVYLIAFLPFIFGKNINTNFIVKRGWLIGLGGIILGLILENYYSRIPDYSFPLMFILFASYWVNHKKFRKIVVIGTFVLLVVSQMMIFYDPFSMRRYYEQDEIDSASKIIDLELNGEVASDLRTSALFRHLGKKDVIFDQNTRLEFHNSMFYNYKSNALNIDYLILTNSMRSIVYSINFQTTPLDNEAFDYYNANFAKVYDDGVMFVYKIK